MCFNFDFLKKNNLYDSFSGACLEAEKSLIVSYSSSAILTRRALELAIKWLYSHDAALVVPYQDNLATLINDNSFRKVIDGRLFPMITYIQKVGNKAVHTNMPVTKEQAVLGLKYLFEVVSWLDYCYSDEMHEGFFDESLLQDSRNEKKTHKELQDLYEKLSLKDMKLADAVKENEELRKKLSAKRTVNKKYRKYTPDDYSEYTTRKVYIDLEIELAGWTINKDCIEEVPVTGMPIPPSSKGEGFVDYVLYADDGKPLAVIEAKRTSKDAKDGKRQAFLYADCLEIQHGVRPLIFFTNGYDYYIWNDKCYPDRSVSGIFSKVDLEWLIYTRDHRESINTIEIDDYITNRYYQKMAIQSVCESFENKRRKALLVMATGSGKTRTAISLVDVLLRKGWVKNILFLADRKELVKQAKNNFNALMPSLSLCNLLDDKDDPTAKMVFSTYPTMMNAIDSKADTEGKRLFTPGHFDLIIIDESHRSIYKKYQAIFQYFDSLLIGLTATPKNDIDKNTYEIFELEKGIPTYAYDLDQAIIDKYLVPYKAIGTMLKLPDEGIHYDSLSDEEKEHFEETFDDDVEDISGDALNTFLFNNDTVDLVLQELMDKGIKIEGGDKLGKTIIFAKNKSHAKFITERFDKLYPHYAGHFAEQIYTGLSYVETAYDNFKKKESHPQIAISVDMLDTGIDVPEIVNLVMFKKVRSKSKFWQMVGRGTRLCPDLFGTEIDKSHFQIFDYCSNFEFFLVEKNEGVEAKNVPSLTERLFGIKVEIAKVLQENEYSGDEKMREYRQKIVNELVDSIQHIDETKFNSRMRIEYIHRYKVLEKWMLLSEKDVSDIREHLATLIKPDEDDEMAKRFDLLMYSIIYADIKKMSATNSKVKVVSTAQSLNMLFSIPIVKVHEETIIKVQKDEFWNDASLFDFEAVRLALRELIVLIPTSEAKQYYTHFTDEIIMSKTYEDDFSVHTLKNYKQKTEQYLIDHRDDMVVHKLRNNIPLSHEDIVQLERILFTDLGTKEDYTREYGDKPLLELVSSIVGLDRSVALSIFSEFLTDESLNDNQMKFVNLIVDFVVKNGLIEKSKLKDQPFNNFGAITKLFENKRDTISKIMQVIDSLNNRVKVG